MGQRLTHFHTFQGCGRKVRRGVVRDPTKSFHTPTYLGGLEGVVGNRG
jgi:hypothetical protein